MTIYRAGQVNIAGITNPGVSVIEQLPTSQIVGVPTNFQGYVGVASWGPVGAVQSFASLDAGVGKYGAPIARKYDFMTHAMVGFQEGSNLFCKAVRVTDGTDMAATMAVTNAGSWTAKYTGIRGNQIVVAIQPTTSATSFAIVVAIPGRTPERFDNIPAATPAAFWANVAAAVNNGTTQRGASSLVVFTPAGTPSAAPVVGTTYALAGGTDGASGVTSSTMIGTDVRPRTGMYALRGSGCDAVNLVDVTDPSTWSAQISFAISEGMLAITATASGDSIANAVAARTTAGIDDPALWIIEGDFPTIRDTVNGVTRLVSPQAQAAGLLGNLSPEQSPINKRLQSVLMTQTSNTGILIDDADESVAQTGGIDLIGKSSALNVDYFTFLTGRNASSNSQANGIEYTRMTSFLARSADGFATTQIVGLLQSSKANDPTRFKAASIFNNFSRTLVDPSSGSNGYGLIEAFAVQCDENNNSKDTISRGYLFLYWAVRYLSVVRYFIVKLAGGNNVDVEIATQANTISGISSALLNFG